MVSNMYKIAISGKANSGKNTVSKFLFDSIHDKVDEKFGPVFKGQICLAFADPIKEMARIMFPHVQRKYFFGSSQYRSEIIPGHFKNGQPLTIRQALIDIGTGLGRGYRDSIWLDVFDHRFNKSQNLTTIIVPDVRFRNEFDHLKNKGFYLIRLKREAHLKIDDISETNQDLIDDMEFDCILYNNSSLEKLQKDVDNIANILV